MVGDMTTPSTKTILIVDDEPAIREVLTGYFEHQYGPRGFAVETAADGAEALRAVRRRRPALVLLDIDMPGMDGVEFIRHVAERRLASAVVIASGLDRSVLEAVEAVGEGYGLQVLGAIEKPLTARRLSELLATYRPAPPPADAARQTPEAEVRAALDDGHVAARFVPIADLAAGAVSGAQAVATWRDGSRLVVEPTDRALAARLIDHVLATACDELARTSLDIELWIAIPAPGLADTALADRLIAIARGRDIDPRRIVCTVAERALGRGAPAELEVLTRLRVKGFGVCLDDFGGRGAHGALEALRRLPLTAVALAGNLVCGAAGDPARAAALEDALDVARELGLPAIARGCDAAADFELLLQLGCRHAQGEFVAGALPGPGLADWALRWRPPFTADGPP